MTLRFVGPGFDSQSRKFFFFSFFGRFVFAIFIFNLLAGFNLFLYFCPVTASRGVAINVFLVIEDYFRH